MLKTYEYESKTEEENINNFIEENNIAENEVIIISSNSDSSLFKSKKTITTFTSKKDLINYIKEYFKELGTSMNLDISVEIRETEGIYNIQLICDNNAILIGKDGRSINALQVILRQTISNLGIKDIKINIDVANYKNKKLKRIEREVKNIAKEVLSSKVDVSLDPMNSYERRFIHNLISEYEGLTTESVGEGLERHIVIKYIGE